MGKRGKSYKPAIVSTKDNYIVFQTAARLFIPAYPEDWTNTEQLAQ